MSRKSFRGHWIDSNVPKRVDSNKPAANDVRGILEEYVDRGLSRRHFLAALTAIGISASGAEAVAQEFEPFVSRGGANPQALPEWAKVAQGTGGQLLVEQLKASGHRYVFINPSSSEAPIFDALVDSPHIQIIVGVHEGGLIAMADGYARASGRVPAVVMSRPGVPSAMTQMYNSFKDHVPLILIVDLASTAARGQDFFEEVDHMEEMPRTITKWQWTIETTRKIPEVFRRAQKFASTRPGGPVFLGIPEDLILASDSAAVMDQRKFDVPSAIYPDPSAISRAARLLLNAQSPLLMAGDEVTMQQAQPELLELAELLALPTTRDMYVTWSMPMPNQHPLWVGQYLPLSRFPGRTDVLLNLGSKMPLVGNTLKVEPSTQLIDVSSNAIDLSRTYPTQVPIIADVKIATRALIEAVKHSASSGHLERIRDARFASVHAYTARARETRRQIAQERWNNYPISNERLALELETVLEKDTCFVSEVDSTLYALMSYVSFGGSQKQYFANSGFALGYALGAAFGIKLALPDRPVVAVMGDGAFLFSGPQPLWSYARYEAPILVVVVNNHSYNNERNRMWAGRGRQFETGQDMACYLGDPNVSFAKMAESFGVEAERVDDPAKLRESLLRGKRATADGRPYLLDVEIERRGNGAASEWHSPFTIAKLRARSV